MAKSAANSKLLKKIQYYLKASKEPVKVYAGWDARTKSQSGEHPAHYMKLNEFGTAHIPPRPFMDLTGKKHRKEWLKLLNLGLQDSMPPRQLGTMIGEKMANDIQDTIKSSVPPPLSPNTRKRNPGAKNDQTLRDTLDAFQHVNFWVGKPPK